jgi:glucosyl-dolichyl phosphate glucuronosyltransferase
LDLKERRTVELSVIICTFNRAESLKVTLHSLAALRNNREIEWEIIVVDNNSKDHSRKVVESFARNNKSLNVSYVFEARQGKSHALNRGIGCANGDIIAFTDDDVTVDENWLEEMWRAFMAFDGIGVAGRVIDEWSTEKPKWYVVEGSFRLNAVIVRYDLGAQPCEIEDRTPPLGANMAFRRFAFERYGGFDTRLGPNAKGLFRGEDSEFYLKLRRAGERVLYLPAAIVFHPVERKRATKKYFRRWYFDYGKGAVTRNGSPSSKRKLMGIPLYFYRDLATNALKRIAYLGSPRGFYHELIFSQVWGSMLEIRRHGLSNEN